MRLNEIKDDETVFIDANIFIYHFTGASVECKEFLKDCARKRFKAFTSMTVLAEVCHRLMAIEAVNTSNLASADRIFNSIPHLNLYSPSDINP